MKILNYELSLKVWKQSQNFFIHVICFWRGVKLAIWKDQQTEDDDEEDEDLDVTEEEN